MLLNELSFIDLIYPENDTFFKACTRIYTRLSVFHASPSETSEKKKNDVVNLQECCSHKYIGLSIYGMLNKLSSYTMQDTVGYLRKRNTFLARACFR